jgi:hypothetical protein
MNEEAGGWLVGEPNKFFLFKSISDSFAFIKPARRGEQSGLGEENDENQSLVVLYLSRFL